MKLRREYKSYIEAELRDYHQTKKEILEAKEDIACTTPILDGEYSGITNRISRPTESKTIAILTNKRIKRMEQVIRAIDVITGELNDPIKHKLINLKYWQRPRRYTDAGIALELGISRRTVYYWVEEICSAIAKELGLINDVERRMRA